MPSKTATRLSWREPYTKFNKSTKSAVAVAEAPRMNWHSSAEMQEHALTWHCKVLTTRVVHICMIYSSHFNMPQRYMIIAQRRSVYSEERWMSSAASVCLFVCVFVCRHDNFRTNKHGMKLGDSTHCTKSRPTSTLRIIAPLGPHSAPNWGVGLRRWENQRIVYFMLFSQSRRSTVDKAIHVYSVSAGRAWRISFIGSAMNRRYMSNSQITHKHTHTQCAVGLALFDCHDLWRLANANVPLRLSISARCRSEVSDHQARSQRRAQNSKRTRVVTLVRH